MNQRNRARRGFSLIELLIVIAIILVIAAMAAPKLTSARMQAQEMAAVTQIRTIQQAQVQYQSQFGKFATTLNELGPPNNGQLGPSAADIIPGDLAKGEKTGYKFNMTQTKDGYAVTAIPLAYNSTGRRTFFSDQSGVIRQNWSQEPATEKSDELK
ncbi:MAG: prepilin-type N-terminal cleavage/methylation domain-containing protein, partial [Bryobacterales bacterium]|nr:prepilin-type N-terminal cleavage/methylation domain-containing protein [Bryobacterales bacterium]